MDLVSLLGFIGDAVDSQVSALAGWVLASFNTFWGNLTSIGGVLTDFISWAIKAVTAIASFLHDLWTWLHDHILSKIIDWIKRHFAWLIRWVKALKCYIQFEQQVLYQIWNTYIKPIMDFIQRLRRALLIFRLLGFRWAQQLDNYLVGVENKINRAFLATWINLNTLSNWVNWILDPLGLWSSNVWLGALGQSISAIIGLVWGTMNTPGFIPSTPGVDTPPNYFDRTQAMGRIALRGQVGPLPDDDAMRQANVQEWAQMGYVVPMA